MYVIYYNIFTINNIYDTQRLQKQIYNICAVTNRHIKVIMDKYKIKYSELFQSMIF